MREQLVNADPAEARTPPTSALLWLSALGGPLAFAIGFEVNYALVDWTCGSKRTAVMHTVIVALLAWTALCTLMCLRFRKVEDRVPEAGQQPSAQTRFIALVGGLMNVIFILLFGAMWFAISFFDPCSR